MPDVAAPIGTTASPMDKLKLAGQTLVRVFNFRQVRVFQPHTTFSAEKLASLEWKTWPKQLSGALPFALASPSIRQIG